MHLVPVGDDDDDAPDPFPAVGLIGSSPPTARLRADILRYARSSASVLVTGETGSGKELVARALHLASPRASRPFVAVNVATLRHDLVASELFGHERGAFTGAITRRRGLFEQAHGGTLFLDEVGELDLRTQADLLRVLETGEVRPVGSERPRAVDVRIIAATHRDLSALVTAGRFREDLYYRLDVLRVAVPPLRERREDIPALVKHLLGRLAHERVLSTAALALLARHAWPGNIRELLNVLRRAVARTDARVIDDATIRDALGTAIVLVPSPRVVHELTDANVADTVRACGGNISAAARRLGIARSTLRERLKTRVTLIGARRTAVAA